VFDTVTNDPTDPPAADFEFVMPRVGGYSGANEWGNHTISYVETDFDHGSTDQSRSNAATTFPSDTPLFDQTDFTESDPNGNFDPVLVNLYNCVVQIQMNAHRPLLHTPLSGGEGDGDWDVWINAKMDSGGTFTTWHHFFQVFADQENSYQEIVDASGSLQGCKMYEASGQPYFGLVEVYGGSVYSAASSAITLGSMYFIRFRWVEADGTYGTLYLDILRGHPGSVALVDSISLALHSSKKDLDHYYIGQALYNTGGVNRQGFCDLQDASANWLSEPPVVTDSIRLLGKRIRETRTLNDRGQIRP